MKNLITIVCPAIIVAVSLAASSADAQKLYVTEGNINTVDAIDAQSGAFTSGFVAAAGSSYTMAGPKGLIFINGMLLVNNQNANTPYNGEVLEFDGNTGQFIKKLVTKEDVNAPWNCRGLLLGPDKLVYLADLGNFNGNDGGLPGQYPGQIRRFGLDGSFKGSVSTRGCPVTFNPRGIVFGPDGLLYVAVVGDFTQGDSETAYVIRFNFNPQTANYEFRDVFVESDLANGFAPHLHAPEGLVFGPDGRLYVTSFATINAFTGFLEDNDQIVVFDKAGNKVNSITLDNPNFTASAQTIIFGPSGDLFAPMITGDTGVRRYTASSGYSQYTILPNAASLVNPWYLTFKTTDPTTLNYIPVAPPTLQVALNTNQTLGLTWSSQAGLNYQLQYKSDLNLTNWTNLGDSVNAAGANIATSDSRTNHQRYYRVVVAP